MKRVPWLLLLAGCTFEWNSETPRFPLTGDPPPPGAFEKLNGVPAARATLARGPDGTPWAAFCEFWTGNLTGSGIARNCKRMRLHRLGSVGPLPCGPRCVPAAAGVDELIDADVFALHGRELFVMRDDQAAMTRTVTMHRPGDAAAADVSFVMPAGRAVLYANDPGGADVFVYWVLEPLAMHYDVFRRDRKYQLTLPVPAGSDPTHPDSFDFLLTADGDTLVVSDPAAGLSAYSTLDGSNVPLRPTAPPFYFIDDTNRAVVTAGDDGLRSIPLAGGPEAVLATAKIDPRTLAVTQSDVFYADGAGLWEVPLDGSAAPALVAAAAVRLLATAPGGEILASHDSSTRYVGGAGDGWIGDWRFMERGRTIRLGPGGARLFFLEHAATIGNYGDLTAADLAGSAPTLLATNVHAFAVLPDGRVLAIENAVYAGNWNRLVVIDENAGSKHWVVPSAVDFVMVSGGREMIVDVVSGASGYDILRVPAPGR